MATDNPTLSGYEALLAELGPLVKAMPAATEEDPEAGAEMEEPDDEGGEGDESEDMLGKSFAVTLPDGTEEEVFDASALVKSMSNASAEAAQRLSKLENAFERTLSLNVSLAKSLKAQEGLVKSLQGDIAKLGTLGAGRKAVLTVHEKPSTTVPEQTANNGEGLIMKGLTPQQFWEKVDGAVSAGRLTSMHVSRAEAYAGNGRPLPEEFQQELAKAFGS